MKTIITKLIVLCLLPFSVFGATHTVTSNGDDNSANQLRTLIGAASPGDEIVFALSSGNETITLSLGQLTIDKNLTIDGSNSGGSCVNVTINGNVPTSTADVTIPDVTHDSIISAIATWKDITIENGGSLQINSTYTLNVTGDYTLADGGSFAKNSTIQFSGDDCLLSDNRTTKTSLGNVLVDEPAKDASNKNYAN